MTKDDIFIKIDGCNGSSTDSVHAGEIDVITWSWGMKASVDAFNVATGRASIHELEFLKRADNASTGIMSALRMNTSIGKAVLTVRKSGGPSALEYLKVTMEKARVNSFQIERMDTAEGPGTVETVRLGFQRIRVEYKDQQGKGGSQGTSTFETSIEPNR